MSPKFKYQPRPLSKSHITYCAVCSPSPLRCPKRISDQTYSNRNCNPFPPQVCSIPLSVTCLRQVYYHYPQLIRLILEPSLNPLFYPPTPTSNSSINPVGSTLKICGKGHHFSLSLLLPSQYKASSSLLWTIHSGHLNGRSMSRLATLQFTLNITGRMIFSNIHWLMSYLQPQLLNADVVCLTQSETPGPSHFLEAPHLHTIRYFPLMHSVHHLALLVVYFGCNQTLLSQAICTRCSFLLAHSSRLSHGLYSHFIQTSVLMKFSLTTLSEVAQLLLSIPLSCFIFFTTLLTTWPPMLFESFTKCQLRKWK